jgi:hypothetical protein
MPEITAALREPAYLPFGKYAGQPIEAVPSHYLDWLLRVCKLSSRLRAVVVGELTRRGNAPTPLAPLRPIQPCRRCGPGAGYTISRQQTRDRRAYLRADCAACGVFLTFPPCVPPYVGMAGRRDGSADRPGSCRGRCEDRPDLGRGLSLRAIDGSASCEQSQGAEVTK